LSQVVVVEEEQPEVINILVRMRTIPHLEIKVEMVLAQAMVREVVMAMGDRKAMVVVAADYWVMESAAHSMAAEAEHHLLVAASAGVMSLTAAVARAGSVVVVVLLMKAVVVAVVVIPVAAVVMTPTGPQAEVVVLTLSIQLQITAQLAPVPALSPSL
jgi:hypothetical protein